MNLKTNNMSLIENTVIDSFDAWDFAVEYASETLNYMDEDELNAIHYYNNKSELIAYLDMFYERT